MRFPHYRQQDRMDCGPTCLRMIAKYYGKYYNAQTLRERTQISRSGVSLLGIAETAENMGFRTVGIRLTVDRLIAEAPLPCVLYWGRNHFVVLYKIERSPSLLGKNSMFGIFGGRRGTDERLLDFSAHPQMIEESGKTEIEADNRSTVFYIADPAAGLVRYTREEFDRKWISKILENGEQVGVALFLEPTTRFFDEAGESAPEMGFGKLISYVLRYKGLLTQLFFGMLLASGLQLLFPFLTQSIVDVGINTQNLTFIHIVLAAQLSLMIGQSATGFIRSWILLHISVRLNLTILSEFLAKLMRLPLPFFDSKHVGDIMQRIGDHGRIETFLTGQTLTMLFSFFSMVTFGAVLAWYNTFIFIVALTGTLLYAFWVILFLKRRRELDVKRFNVSARNQSMIIQLIQGMQDIKLAGAETSLRWKWESIQANLFHWNIKNLSLSQFQEAGGVLINEGKNIFITYLAAKSVLDGQLTLGGMLSVQYILGQFNAPIMQAIGFIRSWQDAKISLERLGEVHNMDNEESTNIQTRKEWPSGLDIVIKGLTYTYPGSGNEPVLKNIDLTIPYGETTAIVGSSGSGKTTLLKMILRFYEPQLGSISLCKCADFEGSMSDDKYSIDTMDNHIPLKYISHSEWRKQCGVVMQEGFIFSDSIARNIAVGEEHIDMDRLYKAARVANILSFIESLPLGYHTKIGADGNGISQGQKQRILIARATYKNPQLLLFDEATNSLDSSNEAVIIDNLGSFFKDRTVVVVAHRLSTVKHAAQILVMEKGTIVERGSHKELIALKGKYFELVSNQLELGE